jgi:hypothetical protein
MSDLAFWLVVKAAKLIYIHFCHGEMKDDWRCENIINGLLSEVVGSLAKFDIASGDPF